MNSSPWLSLPLPFRVHGRAPLFLLLLFLRTLLLSFAPRPVRLLYPFFLYPPMSQCAVQIGSGDLPLFSFSWDFFQQNAFQGLFLLREFSETGGAI